MRASIWYTTALAALNIPLASAATSTCLTGILAVFNPIVTNPSASSLCSQGFANAAVTSTVMTTTTSSFTSIVTSTVTSTVTTTVTAGMRRRRAVSTTSSSTFSNGVQTTTAAARVAAATPTTMSTTTTARSVAINPTSVEFAALSALGGTYISSFCKCALPTQTTTSTVTTSTTTTSTTTTTTTTTTTATVTPCPSPACFGGQTFTYHCDTGSTNGNWLSSTSDTTFSGCATTCAGTTNCVGFLSIQSGSVEAGCHLYGTKGIDSGFWVSVAGDYIGTASGTC